MSTHDISRMKAPVWPTYLIMVMGALLGAVIAGLFVFMSTMSAVAATGPFAMVLMGPAVAAQTATGLLFLVLIPIWALIGGAVFAEFGSGYGGLAGLGVTLLSDTHPVVTRTRTMARELGLPQIKWIGWFDEEAINAFAAGTRQDNAVVAFSKGAIEKLDKEQFEALIGHELGHIANNDMARMTYARAVQEALTWFLVFRNLKAFARVLFTPLSELELLRFSRSREYRADAIGALLTTPQAMIGVLAAIMDDEQKPERNRKWLANLMIRANAFSLFSTHPPLEKRIAALRGTK